MKNIRLFILSLLCLAGVSACMPEEYELGPVDVTADELVQGIAYSVTQDSADPNTIYLKNLMTGYTPLWEHPQGRSQKDEITLKIAFKGEYTIKFGVETAGGYVYGEPYVLNLTTDNLSYVDDPMWNTLTGGKGNSKTWKLDVAADGKCKYFAGPLYFYGTDDWYGNVNGGQEASDYNGDGAVDSWNWAADWAGNGSWLFGSTGAMDYGTMTFDLIDGAHAKVTRLNADGSVESEQNGTFLLDTENYMLTMSDAGILHDPGRDAIVTQWGNARVLQLTEDFLQLGVIRDNDPNEGACLLVYNYVSQNYWDNPPAAEEPAKPSEPVLPENWESIVGTITQTSIKWTLSEATPMNWHSVAGAPLNEFNGLEDYPDWLGTPDPATFAGFSLTMDSADNSYVSVAPDGTEVTGTYTLDEKGIYTFDNGLPTFTIVNWASFAADSDNQLRILQVNTDASGIISDMWVGAKALNEDGSLKEYMSYHLVANVGAGGPAEPAGPSYSASLYFTNSGWWPSGNGEAVNVTEDGSYTVTFDVGAAAADAMVFCVDIVGVRADYPFCSAKVTDVRYDGVSVGFFPENIIYGDLEGNGNLRMEFINEWGYTKSSDTPAIDLTTVNFTKLEVDFDFVFQGYEAQVMMTNEGWWPGYSGVTHAGILGAGRHVVKADLSANGAITSPMVFCLDLLSYPDAATAEAGIVYMKTTDSAGEQKDMTVKAENLAYGDLENKGNLRWEFFNIYGGTGNGVQTAPFDYSMSVIDGAEWTDVTGLEMLVSIK